MENLVMYRCVIFYANKFISVYANYKKAINN